MLLKKDDTCRNFSSFFTLVRRSATGDKRSFRIFIMSFRQTKRCSICMQSWVTHLKVLILSLIVYTHLCYNLFTQQIREALVLPSLFSMTSRRCKNENQKLYITQEYQALSAPRGSLALPPIINKGRTRCVVRRPRKSKLAPILRINQP